MHHGVRSQYIDTFREYLTLTLNKKVSFRLNYTFFGKCNGEKLMLDRT